MSRILYLIASHINPEQVLRLTQTILANSPSAYVLIHHDAAESKLDRSAFSSLNQVHILEHPISVQWGEFSLVEMELYCIDWLLASSIQFDWLVFLSGQDYPIQPIADIEQFLNTTEYDGFMEYFLAIEPPSQPTQAGLHWKNDTGFKRFFYHYYSVPLSTYFKGPLFRLGRFLNSLQSLITLSVNRHSAKLGIRCKPPFNDTFQCYAGSQWHTLSYRCIQYIHEFVQQNPAIVNHYRRTLIPDESFFQTVLLNHSSLNILNNNKRYIAWSGSKPAVLRTQDFDRLVNSDCHFARKLDLTIDAQLFDRIDQRFHSSIQTLQLKS
jgi:hypothetical protein